MSTTRKPAPRLARPAARYWKGKAPKGANGDTDSEEDQDSPEQQEEGDVLIGGDQDIADDDDVEQPLRPTIKPSTTTKAINITLKDVKISTEGAVIVGADATSKDGDQVCHHPSPPHPLIYLTRSIV